MLRGLNGVLGVPEDRVDHLGASFRLTDSDAALGPPRPYELTDSTAASRNRKSFRYLTWRRLLWKIVSE